MNDRRREKWEEESLRGNEPAGERGRGMREKGRRWAVRDEERGIASEGGEGGGVKKSIGPLHYHTLLAGFGTVSVCHNSR